MIAISFYSYLYLMFTILCSVAVPGGDGNCAEVEVVPDGVLQVVVQAALGEPRVQVLP